MKRLSKPGLSRDARWLLYGFIFLLILYFGYDITGRVLWARFKAKYERAGVSFLYEDRAANPPTDEDFFESPTLSAWRQNADFLKPLIEFPAGIEPPQAEKGWEDHWELAEPVRMVSAITAPAPDLTEAAATTQILIEFAGADPLFAQLVEDTKRSLVTRSDQIPMVAKINNFTEILSLRIQANLAAGNAGLAMDELCAGLRISQRMRDLGNLVGLLVELAMLDILEDAVWEGFRRESWNKNQLRQLAYEIDHLRITKDFAEIPLQELSAIEFYFGFQPAYRYAAPYPGGWFSSRFRGTKSKWCSLFADTWSIAGLQSATVSSFELLIPKGHFCFMLYYAGRFYDDFCMDEHGSLSPEFTADQNERAMDTILAYRSRDWLNQIYGVAVPNLGNTGESVLDRQQFYDLARIACELEIYKQRAGEYPDTLSVPNFEAPADRYLPVKKVRYRKVGERYTLIGAGEDRTDDAGDPDKDMVWRFVPE